MKPLKILVVDDEKLIRWSFEKQLTSKGHVVYTAQSGEEGIELFQKYFPDLVFVDNKLPKMQGLDVITQMKLIYEDAIVIFMTAYGSIDTAVLAMKKGASEYVNKPFNFEEINILIDNVNEKISVNKEIQILKRQKGEEVTFENIICESAEIREVVSLARKIARTDTTTVLLLGESGTGKDVFARAIHNESGRSAQAFVTINCSSLPETLLESELFGYEKGAFTDAKKMKKGLFEIAEGGTVFLDEIGEINLATQVKLLGVLENRTVRRLGGTVDIPVDVRVIAATNKNMAEAIADKTFREDLYYRLKVFQIRIPPLRERRDDIMALVDYFIKLFNERFRKSVKEIGENARKQLLNYMWPGNVRELRNVMERAVILESDGVLRLNDLPSEIRNSNVSEENVEKSDAFEIPEEGISLYEWEKKIINQALIKADHNQTKASKLLGISRDTLRYKQKKYDL